MAHVRAQVDNPEPRWQALLALAAVGGVYLSLPSDLIIGPTWLLPAVIALSLAPTIVAHRMGHYSFNHGLGIVNNSLLTVALLGSVGLLVVHLPSHKDAPLRLLLAGAELWLTNVLLFALWYWGLDGGGPTVREQHPAFGSRSFVFPQMQIEQAERERFRVEHWRPSFVDYLFIAFTQSSTFGPTDAPLLARWAKLLAMVQIFISLSIVILLIARAVGGL